MVHKSIDDEVYSASDLAGKIEVVEPKLNQEKSPKFSSCFRREECNTARCLFESP